MCNEGGIAIEAAKCEQYAGNESGQGTGETGGDTGGETSTTGSEDDWAPSQLISYDRRTDARTIATEFVDAVQLDPSMLNLDTTRVSLEPTTGYYEVLSSGELGGALGWEGGDLFLSVNGHDLQGLDAVLDAYLEVEGMDRFELELERQGETISLIYRIE